MTTEQFTNIITQTDAIKLDNAITSPEFSVNDNIINVYWSDVHGRQQLYRIDYRLIDIDESGNFRYTDITGRSISIEFYKLSLIKV